ncbi:NgoPII family restriction endonuclease [Conchiformibius steedae]|uniref:NgoPII family restriction endonuclease n=1 Tax=Conchiformibius steedae TaxID=153493 RepID=UPI0026EF8195|nr:NgoPII family restriction endonuclease [Conchiformibius steedae]
MSHILNAIYHLVSHTELEIQEQSHGSNRMNDMGAGLEDYIKDLFADSFGLTAQEKMQRHEAVFLWSGNATQPPDLILTSGDAIEIKKVESIAELQLNSSFPKQKVWADDEIINQHCRQAMLNNRIESSDLIYCIGQKDKKSKRLCSLWAVYGDVYAASRNVYEEIKNRISNNLQNMEHTQFEETREIGRLNKVDPLGISNLRIRGMWLMKHPKKFFAPLLGIENGHHRFELVCIMKQDKYHSFSDTERARLEALTETHHHFSIQHTYSPNPDNPAQRLPITVIRYIIPA